MVSSSHAPFHTARRAILSVLCVLAAGTEAGAQGDIHAQIFRAAGETRVRAKQVNAEFLAPRNFERGTDAYSRAENLFSRQKPLDDIREQVRLAAQSFTRAVEASKTAQREFAPTLKARSDAIGSDASRLSPGLWDQAEKLLLSAAASLEDGDDRSGRREAGEAQGIYRSAELEAIKLSLLTPARELLVAAEQLNAKATASETMERAYHCLEVAEAMVNQNRYDLTEARQFASDAKYEAAHALYLHTKISRMQLKNTTFEDAILLSEAAIGEIGSALNTPVRFDGGYEPVVQQIITAVRSRDSARTTLAESLRRLQSENRTLHRRIASLEGRGGAKKEAGANPEREPEELQRFSSAVALAATYFDSTEGGVLRDGQKIVLRIFGLTFTPENDALASDSFELLSKIDHAIRLFPNCQLTVEGHTETGESETLNEKNSAKRAATLAAYLTTSPPASSLIESRGWGSSCPIADNTTAAGRALNRRIDVVIVPEPSIVRR